MRIMLELLLISRRSSFFHTNVGEELLEHDLRIALLSLVSKSDSK